jgi:putative ABC transport system permease protein
METFFQDLRFAFRNLRRTPAFPVAAIATLALGVGATTAIFSTVNAALLRPLPYPNARDLYALRTTLTDGRVTTGNLASSEIARLNDPSLSIVKAAGLQPQEATFLGKDNTPRRTRVYAVTEGFFDVFGLPMAVGHGFTPDQIVENGPPLAIISHRVWRDQFGSDPAIVGKPIRFAEITTTIAAVAHQDFDTPHNADFWFYIRADPQGVQHSFEGYMRLKPGTNIERARSEMASVMNGLARDFPASAKSRAYVVRPLIDSIVGDLGPILIIVLSATALLLLLACVNVTNLLLARGATRAREMAVRVALGAGRGRIVRQLLTESVLLAIAGTGVGLLVAYVGVRMLLNLGARTLPRLDAVPFDTSVLMFALVALVVSGVLVGFAPALRLARTDVRALMNEAGRTASGGRATARWLNAMTVAQIALAITLVAGAGWLIRGFQQLRTTNPGFVADKRLVFDVTLQGPKYRDIASVVAGWNDVFDRLRRLPGVTNVGATSSFPLRGTQENSILLQLRGETMDPSNPMGSRQRFATPGLFTAMGVRMLAGRDFANDDRQGTELVAIVNNTFVRRYLAGKDPLTIHFAYGYPIIDPKREVKIIGVVDDVRQKSLSEAAEPAFYTSAIQFGTRRLAVVVATTLADTNSLQSAIREEMKKFEPLMAIDFERVPEIVSSTLRRQELGMTLMLLFGAAAVALAAVGIYGVIAYGASQRTDEVATRLALGATQMDAFWLVVKQGRALALIGTVIGLGVAYGAGRIVSSRIYEVRASDPAILGMATALVVSVAIVATIIPAWRVSRTAPSRVLRAE